MNKIYFAAVCMFSFITGKGQAVNSASPYTIGFIDPAKDDNGNGDYVYPVGSAFTKGSFDLLQADIKVQDGNARLHFKMNAKVEDRGGYGTGFSQQLIMVYIDTDGKPAMGHTETLAGVSATFKNGGWEKCIFICAASEGIIKKQIADKASLFAADIILPRLVKGAGDAIDATIDLSPLGDIDLQKCRYQILVAGYDPYPLTSSLLIRRVNENASEEFFGGGTDYDCDPNIIDCLAGKAVGDENEADQQERMLNYQCTGIGASKKKAQLLFIDAPAAK